jgi:hypothetical protein
MREKELQAKGIPLPATPMWRTCFTPADSTEKSVEVARWQYSICERAVGVYTDKIDR